MRGYGQRRDANEPAVVEALKRAGAEVWRSALFQVTEAAR